MAEVDNKSANLLAQETSQLEEQLQGWGEVILAGDKVLRWEKPWYPAVLVGATTMVFIGREIKIFEEGIPGFFSIQCVHWGPVGWGSRLRFQCSFKELYTIPDEE